MAWETYVEGVERVGDAISINAVFVDKAKGRKEARTVRASAANKESVFAALRAERDRLDALDIAKRDIPLGVPVDIDEGLVAPPAPDPDAVAFFRKLGKLRDLSELITLGVLDGSQTELVTLRADLAKAYNPAFYGVSA